VGNLISERVWRERSSPAAWLVAGVAALGCCGGSACRIPYETTVQRLTPPAAVRVSPGALRQGWVRRGTAVTLHATLSRSDGADLPALGVDRAPAWLDVRLTETAAPTVWALDADLDSEALEVGEHSGEIVIVDPADVLLPAVVPVWVQIWELSDLHVGIAADSCPHLDAAGATATSCHHAGPGALDQALSAAQGGDTRILLHDDDGDLAEYSGCIDVPGRTWLNAAEGVDPRLVAITCVNPGAGRPDGVLRLIGDRSRVARLSLVNLENSGAGISTWTDPDDPGSATSGHLVENVYGVAMNPELIWANGVDAPLELGPDTTIRNCRFTGYYDGQLDLRRAHRSRLLNNTLVFYGSPKGPIDVSGAQDLVLANNAILSLSRRQAVLLQVSAETHDLVVSGNAVEGYGALVGGLTADGVDGVVADNLLGEVEVESPYRPYFLVDSAQSTGAGVAGEGQSLDGVSVAGRLDLLPGAHQQRSERSGPRAMVVRVGNTGSGQPGCGEHECDIRSTWPNEIQVAVWSAWPGAEVLVYPASVPYAGNAIISWGITLRGESAEDAEPSVVLQSEEEDTYATAWGLWERHRALLAVLEDAVEQPVTIENLVLRVDPAAQTNGSAVLIEGSGDSVPATPHTLRRLRVEASAGVGGLEQALLLGDRVLVQDVLLHGPFGACVRFGPQHGSPTAWPEAPATSGWVVNLTCRLTGVDERAARAGFEVDWVTETLFANLVVQLAPPGVVPVVRAPLFDASRQPPVSLSAYAVTVQGHGATCADFSCDGSGPLELTDLEELLAADELFVSASDSHIHVDSPAAAIDGGVNFWLLDDVLAPGRSLDGIDRTDSVIDRGAYEQGG